MSDKIVSKPSTKAYRDGWDRVFGENAWRKNAEEVSEKIRKEAYLSAFVAIPIYEASDHDHKKIIHYELLTSSPLHKT